MPTLSCCRIHPQACSHFPSPIHNTDPSDTTHMGDMQLKEQSVAVYVGQSEGNTESITKRDFKCWIWPQGGDVSKRLVRYCKCEIHHADLLEHQPRPHSPHSNSHHLLLEVVFDDNLLKCFHSVTGNNVIMWYDC